MRTLSQNQFFVTCTSCSLDGPFHPTRTLAIDGWNDLWERKQVKEALTETKNPREESIIQMAIEPCRVCHSINTSYSRVNDLHVIRCNNCLTTLKGLFQDEVTREWNKPSAQREATSAAAATPDKAPVSPINPGHYRSHPSGVECIEITRHMNFNIGNAIKYLWRHGQKANAVEDLKKARWYLDDEIKRLEAMPEKSPTT